MKVTKEDCRNILYELTLPNTIDSGAKTSINEYIDDLFDNPIKREIIGLDRFILRTYLKWAYK